MKKITALFILLITGITHAQTINFTDPNFKARLLSALPTNTVAMNVSGYYTKIDSNNNGEIEQNEALMVINLNINGQNISNLEGLQYFTNLTVLNLDSNYVTSINLSSLTQLYALNCHTNQLTSLDLSGLPNLVYLFCNNNSLTQLDFSALPNLKMVYCGNNQLTSLDFSYNPLFEDLGCENNPNLTSIKIKNNHQQLFEGQTFLNECWLGNPNLNYICADSFEIPSLLSFLSDCGITQTITIDSSCSLLGAEEFEKKEFGVLPNPSKSVFTISFPKLIKNATIVVYNLMGQSIYSVNMSNFEEFNLDLSQFSSGTYLLKVNDEENSYTKHIIKN